MNSKKIDDHSKTPNKTKQFILRQTYIDECGDSLLAVHTIQFIGDGLTQISIGLARLPVCFLVQQDLLFCGCECVCVRLEERGGKMVKRREEIKW